MLYMPLLVLPDDKSDVLGEHFRLMGYGFDESFISLSLSLLGFRIPLFKLF